MYNFRRKGYVNMIADDIAEIGFDAITNYIAEIGFGAIKNKVLSIKQQQAIKSRIKDYVELQKEININCTLEEELDFAGLADYIKKDLLKDVQVLLFGRQNERANAKMTIINKAVSRAQSKTNLTRARAQKIIEAAIEILQNFYRTQIDNQLKFVSAEIIDSINDAVEEQIFKQTVNLATIINKHIESVEEDSVKEKPLPHILTKTVSRHTDTQSVIHREEELRNIKSFLMKKTALLLSGFGGIGKTALLRVLYTDLIDEFDSLGWIEYHGNLKDSLLASIELYDEIEDQEKRWNTISKRLKTDSTKKILLIDNVDYDAMQMQNPEKDLLLQEISGWYNMTVVMTSRMAEVPGFYSYLIDSLGAEEHIQPCVDLFYYYYDKNEYQKVAEKRQQKEAVRKLVLLANFHTYAIELLARSAIYEDNLFYYYERIKALGFKFPTLSVPTGHSRECKAAAEQLRLLFNMQSRSAVEQQILWDFSVLPEGAMLSNNEVKQLLGYNENQLDHLCKDGWLRCERCHGFYVHPLVKEIVHFDLREGKAPSGTVGHLINIIQSDALLSNHDTQADILRKLHLVETIEKFIVFDNAEKRALFYYQIGLIEYKFARKRLTSVHFLEKALESYSTLEDDNKRHVAKIRYQIGYIKSTTHQYRDKAKIDLKAALDIWETCENCETEVAMAHDHLGYVLTDSAEMHDTARYHLIEALKMRKLFLKNDPTPLNRYAYSTTCDNLGYLLSKLGGKIKGAMKLLQKALSIREDLYATSAEYATDVAWTAFNLGELLSGDTQYYNEAERYFRKALELRRLLEHRHPQMYTTNIVFTLVSLAKLLSVDSKRMDEVRELFNEAINLWSKIDSDHTGFFSDEIEMRIRFLSDLLNEK